MSPTSYQTAPPRERIITTMWGSVKCRTAIFRRKHDNVALQNSYRQRRHAHARCRSDQLHSIAPQLVDGVCASPTDGDSHCFSFGRWHASTIFVGSIASLSTCSSAIFPSLPTRKFTRRAVLYL